MGITSFDTSLLDNMPVAIGICSYDGKISYVNIIFKELFGYTLDEIPDLETWAKKAYPDETYREWALETWEADIKKLIDDGHPYQPTEYTITCKDGSEKIIELSISIKDNYLLVFFRDNTEISHSKEEIETQKKFSEKLIDSLPGNFYLFKRNKEDFGLIRWNKNFSDFYGYEEDKLFGKSPTFFIAKSHKQQAENAIHEIFDKGYIEIELNVVTNNGAEKPQYITGVPFYDKSNIYFLGLGYDISKQKQTEEELRVSREKAVEGEKLKSAFLANMSHEIRTPLNGILGFSGLLDNDELSSEDRSYYLEVINQSSNQLLSIVDDILIISKMETGQMEVNKEEVFINGLLQSLQEKYIQQAQQKNISLSLNTSLKDEQSIIISDNDKLEQILDNLISNAIKFTHTGHVLFGYNCNEDSITFYVEDTGIGINPENHALIFERFQQVDIDSTRVYGGTGLGLTIAKGNVELLGGKIWLESVLGQGTVFSFSIPFTQVYKEETELELKKKGEMEGKPVILIAEDEEINFLYLEESLKDYDYEILRAHDGIEAIEHCKNNDKIKLVLMDIKMPNMDGYRAFEEISAIRPELPVIAQTAYAMLSDREMALKAGFKDYLAKPIKTSDLLNSIDKYLE